jgi:putative membrane protein
VVTAASSDQFEIASCQMALKRSHDRSVRQLAKQLIADHSKSSSEMTALVARNDMQAPPSRLMSAHQQELDMLSRAGHFDREFLSAQEKAHADGIALFQQYSTTGGNADLRNFATKTLPVLQKHYDMVEQAENQRHRTK